MAKEKILVVDDEEMIRWTLAEALKRWGYQPVEASRVSEALSLFDSEQPAAVLLDINLPDGSGLDALREMKRRQPLAVVIMITAEVFIENTIEALRGGAYDFVGKPINLEELQVTIRNGIETGRLRREVVEIRKERARQFSFDQIVGSSPPMKEMTSLAYKVAESEVSSVLLQGESGTGKDLLAKAIHYASRRSNAPFVAINCAALPANLIESELFGYEKGAFTDAKARKEGMFEQAEGGTLLLDEIGELELSLQAKLLRVLEEGAFRRVGGLKDIPLDVRVIAASNRDLKRESEDGRFRLDLYYRLSVIQIDVPALRERGEDIIALAESLIERFNKQLRKHIRGLSPAVAALFLRYPWPGNVRELRNVVERVMILEDSDEITSRYLPKEFAAAEAGFAPVLGEPAIALSGHSPHSAGEQRIAASSTDPLAGFRLPPDGISLDSVEASLVQQAMERSGGNQTRAAMLLSISRDQLRYRLKKLDEEQSESNEEAQPSA